MSFSFSINSKSQPNRLKKQTTSFRDAAETDSSTINFVSEFRADEAPPLPGTKIKPIAPIPNEWRPNKKLKNLTNIPLLSQSNGADSGLQFELDPGINPESGDSSMGYGLNIRQPTESDAPTGVRGETVSDLELRKLREDLEKLPDGPGLEDFDDVPVEGFGAALLSGYGWKEGRGIGRNAKEDVKVAEVTRKAGRGGLGFIGEFPESKVSSDGNAGGNIGNANARQGTVITNGNNGEDRGNANVRKEKMDCRKDKKGFDVGEEVRIVNGNEVGKKAKIVEVRDGGSRLVLRISKNNEKVEVGTRDVAGLGSLEEEKCLRKLKELKVNVRDVDIDKKERNRSGKRRQEGEKARKERVNWLRNHIRVRIISQEFKGGRLYKKKGVVVDVVGPGVCDISIDESREIVQGVEQELLETALPKRGGPVLILYGRHKGVYGNLVDRDSEEETGVVRDADTHEMINVKLDQIAEYTGDPSDIGY